MITYLIDAFNMIHAVQPLKGADDPHHGLISFIALKRLCGSRNNNVVIVFDGNVRQGLAAGERNFKIIFSYPKTADEVIIQYVTKLPRRGETVVITNDRSLSNSVKSLGAKVKGIEEFVNKGKRHGRAGPLSGNEKNIGYALKREITEEMRKIWLKDK